MKKKHNMWNASGNCKRAFVYSPFSSRAGSTLFRLLHLTQVSQQGSIDESLLAICPQPSHSLRLVTWSRKWPLAPPCLAHRSDLGLRRRWGKESRKSPDKARCVLDKKTRGKKILRWEAPKIEASPLRAFICPQYDVITREYKRQDSVHRWLWSKGREWTIESGLEEEEERI